MSRFCRSSSSWPEVICGKQSPTCRLLNGFILLQRRLRLSPLFQVGHPYQIGFNLSSAVLTVVHEISGVVPGDTIDGLLRAMAVEPGQGIDQSLGKGGFETVRKAVKGVIREGWSAGQVLEQVS